jgi:glycyl-tRNA synthetase beta chain
VAKLARWLVEQGIVKGASADDAERAARLCKADLVTGMVGEFPELQGIMGGYYARAQGESDAVADAIRDHYKPVGQGDDVPTAPVTVAVSLADKLDTICGFFLIQQEPTGSKDPFALRRAAIASGSITMISELRVPLLVTFANAVLGYVETAYDWSQRAVPAVNQQVASLNRWTELREFATVHGIFEGLPSQPQIDTLEVQAAKELLEAVKFPSAAVMLERVQRMVAFMFDRLKVQQREAGIRHDLIDAVFSLGGEDDLVRLLARVKALQNYISTAEGANLLAAYKRAANILKGSHPVSPVLDKASDAPMSDGEEQQIPQTGEEDPFVDVDQGMRAAIAGNHGRTEGTVPEGAVAADIALLGALDIAEQQAEKAIEAEQYEDAMAALATLREPIDRFFDEVMVNDEDPAKRAFRLGLLARFRDAVHRVADFSKIEG